MSFKSVRQVFAVLAVSLLAACVPPSSGEIHQIASQNQTIAVHSIVPDEFQNILIGTTVFNNESTTLDTSSWQMGRFFEQTMKAKLAKSGVSTARIKSLPKTPLVQDDSLFGISQKKQLAPVFTTAKAQGIDRLLIIAPSFYKERVEPQPPYGYFKVSKLGRTIEQFVYISMYVEIYDVQTQKVLSSTRIDNSLHPVSFALTLPKRGKETSVPFKTNAASYTTREKAILQKEIKTMFTQLVNQSFKGNP